MGELPRGGHDNVARGGADKLRLIPRAATLLVCDSVDEDRRAGRRNLVDDRSDYGSCDHCGGGDCGCHRDRVVAASAITVVASVNVHVHVPVDVNVVVYVYVSVYIRVIVHVCVSIYIGVAAGIVIDAGTRAATRRRSSPAASTLRESGAARQ